MKFPKPQFSKVICAVSTLIFCWVLYMGFTMDFTSVCDTTFIATAITISGGLVASSIISYMRKAQLENVQHIKANIYKVSVDERIRFLKETLELKAKYGEFNVDEIELGSPMDEFENEALMDMSATGNVAMSESEEKVEKEI